ncbi:MAG TPA: 23S rRNA pseudouridine(2604) synthase RluF [Candidatus Merdenecus merdavium]|nr:23S rRNA pseudouridine(2604) synthase RluF [Candidatus Merdenecus merdavium]
MDKITQEFKNKDTEELVRLNKYLSNAGVCSRREADRLIETGKVTVDGVRAEMGMKVNDTMEIKVNKKIISSKEKMVLIAVNKPVGIVCTTDPREKDNIVDFLKYPQRIYHIGRLDKDSEGLLLMTNNGDIVNKILRSGNQHEKEYIVTVNRPITKAFIKKMSEGVPILDTVTKPCKVTPLGKNKFNIILTQGLNRQIRRMCEYLGYKVVTLKRIRIMNIHLGRLHSGGYRNLTTEEMNKLYMLMEHSSNTVDAREDIE